MKAAVKYRHGRKHLIVVGKTKPGLISTLKKTDQAKKEVETEERAKLRDLKNPNLDQDTLSLGPSADLTHCGQRALQPDDNLQRSVCRNSLVPSEIMVSGGNVVSCAAAASAQSLRTSRGMGRVSRV